MPSPDDITKGVAAIIAWAGQTQKQISQPNADVVAIFAQRTAGDAGQDLRRFMDLLEPPPVDFEEFIQRMSLGVVRAQEKLDEESAGYLTAIADKPHVLPAIFRVPKLSAQMKFALKVDASKKLNLLFFSKTDQTESQNEQSIDFEVVNVPAPPGAAAELQAVGPMLDLVLDRPLRTSVIEQVGKFDDKADGIKDIVLAARDRVLAARLIVLTFGTASDGATRFLLWHATDQADKSVGLWLLTRPKTGDGTLETIYKFTTANGPNENILRKQINALGDRLLLLFGDA
jgi:hypothetical protein